MYRFLQILLLFAFSFSCSPACAQTDAELKKLGEIMQKNVSYHEGLYEYQVNAIVTYRNYLIDKNSVPTYQAVAAAKTILGMGYHLTKRFLGVALPIWKTLPKDFFLRNEYDHNAEGRVFVFDNGKMLLVNGVLWIYELTVKDMVEKRGDCHILVNTDGSFGVGCLMKKSDAKKKNIPSILVNEPVGFDKVYKNVDYVIGCGFTGNAATKNDVEIFERAVGLRNDTKDDVWGFKGDEYWLGRESITLKKVRQSPADLQAFENAKENARKKLQAQREAERTEEFFGDDIRKYGAAAVKRLRTKGPWIGMPRGLVVRHYDFVKSTESFGRTVEIYHYRKTTLWVSNGKVIKIVKRG